MEVLNKKIKIPTKDGYFIYGTITSKQNDNKNLLIFVHGMSDNQNNPLFKEASIFFYDKDYNIFRFNLYGKEKLARKASQTLLSTQIKDLNIVISNFKKQYKNIYLIGHSLGGYLVLTVKKNYIKNRILWDPSMEPCKIPFPKSFNKKIKTDVHKIPTIKELLTTNRKNLDLIFAENGAFKIALKTYLQYLPKTKTIYKTKGANHIFSENKSKLKLFTTTLKLLK